MKQRFVLDTNCLIDLEQRREDAVYLDELLKAWEAGNIELAITAVSASENQAGNLVTTSYDTFQENLKSLGLHGVTELSPLAVWDVFFWDHCLWSDENKEKLEKEIRDVLFPNVVTIPPKKLTRIANGETKCVTC